MKKLIIFIIFLFVIITGYVMLFNRKISYELEYDIDKYSLKESYDKINNYYTFTLSLDDQKYDFMLKKKYSPKRKLVKDVLVESINDYQCVSVKVLNNYIAPICTKNGNYFDGYISGLNKKSEDNRINTIKDIEIYNNDYDFYIWNGYGITNVLTQKEYNFLKKEHYENAISYRLGKYIIFADYDSSREFSKFYIFDSKELKISDFEFEYKISMDSYFNGNVNDDLYLFDKKNKKQYKININKKKIGVSSTSEYAINYDQNLDEVALSEFIYSNVIFNNVDFINYKIKNQKLYYKYYNLNEEIMISEKNVKDIVYSDGIKVYYLVDDDLYLYDINTGEQKLLKYFEWNFSYKNKIFIFDNKY